MKGGEIMTLQEIKESEAVFLLPKDIAQVMKCDPHFIRVAARENPALLGFPVTVTGRRTKIPRKPFLKFIGELEEGEGD